MTLKPAETNIKAVISGSSYFIDNECAKIANMLHDTETHNYFADEIVPEEFFVTLFTPSILYDKKAVFVYRIENYKKLDVFFGEIAKARDVSIIITLSAARKDDSKKFIAMLKKTETIRALAAPLGFKFIFENKQTNMSLAAEIKNIFGRNGLTITLESADRIGEMLGWDISRVEPEAEKLSLYCNGKTISSQELLGYISGQFLENRFSFIRALLEKLSDRALMIYSQLPEIENDAAVIFNMLKTYFGWLYFKLKAPTLCDFRNPLFIGKSSYFVNTVDKVYRRWKAEDVSVIIGVLARLDVEEKTGRIDYQGALVLIIKQILALNCASRNVLI